MSKQTCLLDKYVISFKDHKGVYSAVFYTNVMLCDLNCFKCHNKNKAKLSDISFITEEDLKEKLSKLKLLGIELIIICGGEPTLVSFDKLSQTLKIIKNFDFKIRLDTNGQNFDCIKKLVNEKLVDGFAIDVKIPLSKLKKHYAYILFSRDESLDRVKKYQENLKKTLSYVSNLKLDYLLLRTVKYPFFDNEDLELIKKDVSIYNIKHFVNNFVD